jgi:hypothetical protein
MGYNVHTEHASLRAVAAHTSLCEQHRFDRNLINEKQREWHSLIPVADSVSNHLSSITLPHRDDK